MRDASPARIARREECMDTLFNAKIAIEKLSGRNMSIKTLIMQNLGVLSYHGECIKTYRPMLISFRPHRCCVPEILAK
jgi:hypothetical protein